MPRQGRFDAQEAYRLWWEDDWTPRQIAAHFGCSVKYAVDMIEKVGDPITYHAVRLERQQRYNVRHRAERLQYQRQYAWRQRRPS